jgi:hypothetical protein
MTKHERILGLAFAVVAVSAGGDITQLKPIIITNVLITQSSDQPAVVTLPPRQNSTNGSGSRSSYSGRRSSTNNPAAVGWHGTKSTKPDVIRAANLIYAGSKSSVCFSGKFLSSLAKDSRIETESDFTPVRLATDQMYEFPFAVMTGEGSFTLMEQERRNLASYLKKGGFVLASAGCSSPEWDRSFRAEIAKTMPDAKLQKLPFSHPIYHTIFNITHIALTHGGSTQLEGLELNGRIVLVYSPEGLNDTSNVSGCCCCGGNEVQNSHEINVNIFAYAVMH